MKHILDLGKIDYDGSGRRINKVTLGWELLNGKFSMSGTIWNSRGTDACACGQIIDEIGKAFPQNKKVQRMVMIGKRWHLNDLRAGTPRQEAWLREHKKEAYEKDRYTYASEELTRAGLNPDNGYRYGSAWLREELPAEVVEEINSWSVAPKQGRLKRE